MRAGGLPQREREELVYPWCMDNIREALPTKEEEKGEPVGKKEVSGKGKRKKILKKQVPVKKGE